MTACLATLLAALLAAEPEAAEPPPPPEEAPRTKIEAGVAGGVGAGVILLPPVPFAAPWLGVEAGFQRRFGAKGLLGADLGLSLGPSAEGGTAIGGYSGVGHLGLRWFDTGTAALDSYGRLGIASFTLIPIPVVGLGHQLAFTHFEGKHLRWRTGFDLNTDILPLVISGGVWTQWTWALGGFFVGARLKAGYSVGILGGVNGALGIRLSTGWRF